VAAALGILLEALSPLAEDHRVGGGMEAREAGPERLRPDGPADGTGRRIR
jgi:hypothetical protein